MSKLTPEECVTRDENPRSGMWPGEQRRPGGLALTQESTDALIRFELLQLTDTADRDAITAAVGLPLIINIEGRAGLEVIDIFQATCQRGGIDSDPLVRVLAYRTWGDRDRRWAKERGVRKGDRVSLVDGSDSVSMRGAALAWSDEEEIGIALDNAAPGSLVRVQLNLRAIRHMNRHQRYVARTPKGGVILRPHVSDRLRAELRSMPPASRASEARLVRRASRRRVVR